MDQMFSIEVVSERVLDALRKCDSPMASGAIAADVDVPIYAADAALESLKTQGDVLFLDGVGWYVVARGDKYGK